jgi:hypothetical protein
VEACLWTYSVFHKCPEDDRDSYGMRQQAGSQELCDSRRPVMKHALRIDDGPSNCFNGWTYSVNGARRMPTKLNGLVTKKR